MGGDESATVRKPNGEWCSVRKNGSVSNQCHPEIEYDTASTYVSNPGGRGLPLMELPSCPGRFVLRGTCGSSQRPSTATAKHNIKTALNAFKTMGGGWGGRGGGVSWLGSEETIMEGDFQVTALGVRFPWRTKNTRAFRSTRVHSFFSYFGAEVLQGVSHDIQAGILLDFNLTLEVDQCSSISCTKSTTRFS